SKTRRMRMRVPVGAVLAVLAFGSSFYDAAGQGSIAAAPAAVTLFENVRVFDGTGEPLSPPTNVLVRGNKIETISAQPIAVDRRADTRIIDGGGRTLMPGLIDVHWHA